MFKNKKPLSKNLEIETKNLVPKRMAPRQLPGVYIVVCHANNKCYIGESTNVSARLSQHKSRLRRNIHEVSELQHDWNHYKESFFEFSALFMARDCSKAQREAFELEMIQCHVHFCYNKVARCSRKKQKNPFWRRHHTKTSRKQIGKSLAENYKNRLCEGLKIQLKGKLYPSISEASRQTNHSRDTIRRWLNDPNNSCAILMNRPTIEISKNKTNPRPRGLYKPVCLDGINYSSISEASRKLDCSRANIQRRLRTDKENCFFIYPDR